MIDQAIQFFLINHIGLVGFVIGALAVAGKVYIIRNCQSHPDYNAEAKGFPIVSLKVYIAAPYPMRAHAQHNLDTFERAGFIVTSSWLRVEDTMTDAVARKDLADVAAADVLLLVNPEAWSDSGTGGRHVELGYALALGKRVVLVGKRSNIFHYLDQVICVETVDEAMAAMRSWPPGGADGRALHAQCPSCGTWQSALATTRHTLEVGCVRCGRVFDQEGAWQASMTSSPGGADVVHTK